MNPRRFLQLEEHAFFIVFISILLIFFWIAVWGITEDTVEWLAEKYSVKKVYIYWGLLLVILGFIALFPQLLAKL